MLLGDVIMVIAHNLISMNISNQLKRQILINLSLWRNYPRDLG